MKWLGCLAVLVLVGSSYIATALMVPKKGAPSEKHLNCTEHISLCDDDWFDHDKILGVWYRVSDDPQEDFCLNFEMLTKKQQKALATHLEHSLNETDDNRFFIKVTKKCPELIMSNNTEYKLMTKLDDKGIFDTFIGHSDSNRLVHLTQVHLKLIQLEGTQYLLSKSEGSCLMLTREPKIYNIQNEDNSSKHATKEINKN